MPSPFTRAIRYVRSLKLHVEPIIFVMAMCNVARAVVKPHMTEMKMRRTYPHPEHMSPQEIKKFYNKWMVTWDQNYDYVNMPIACVIGILYGAYSDERGRKIPLLIGMVSTLIDNTISILMWSETTDIALEWTYLAAVVSGLMGDFLLFMSAVNAYLADIFPNKKTLSTRMIIVSVIFSLGSLVGSLCTKFVVERINHLAVMYLVQGAIVLAFGFSLGILERKRPSLLQEYEPDEPQAQLTLLQICKNGFISVYDSAKVFCLRREGHRRLFLWICLFANFLDLFVFGEEKGLIGTYTRLAPFNWDTDQYATYKTVRPIAQIIGMFFGLIVLKKLLHLRDTTQIILAIASMGLCAVAIGLATSSWIIYASLAPGSLHGLLNPLTYTFMTCLVRIDEIGKAFAISSIAGKLAGIAQTAILQNIYKATVDWYQGFVWLLMGAVSGVAAVMYLYVHVVSKQERIGAEDCERDHEDVHDGDFDALDYSEVGDLHL
ncbi:hypothetical protein QR680_008277 [Steinernema hermaphroditum]|uniref:Major facilitator superfamily (MFS) profile domain-containing protein n=1 Tax=Steinernema hermaphroditum TaxID=289476 RepID=A0AA39IG12_9BILA|nr:hypothetical protein QR680_008277 [Steinernema hermaphroditum]